MNIHAEKNEDYIWSPFSPDNITREHMQNAKTRAKIDSLL